MNWTECIKLARTINQKYSLSEKQQHAAYKYAKKLAPGSIIVELGVAHGKTAAILAYVAKYRGLFYHGVDNYALPNPDTPSPYGSKIELEANLKRLKLPFTFHYGGTNTIFWNELIDFLLIDAGHNEVNVRTDIERWVPFVNPEGYVLFHDYDELYNPESAHEAVRRYADMYTGKWIDLDLIDGLKIRQRPKKEIAKK